MRSPKFALALGASALALLALASPTLHAADDPGNLLVNGDFAIQEDASRPANWKTEPHQKITFDTTDVPAGSEHALKVEIISDQGKTQGSITQEVKVEPNKAYKLTGWVTASTRRLGFLSVKLREGKKEGKRLYSDFGSADWKEVSLVFNTETADNVLVMCRYNQKPELAGQTCAFANLKLVEATPEEAATAASAPAEEPK